MTLRIFCLTSLLAILPSLSFAAEDSDAPAEEAAPTEEAAPAEEAATEEAAPAEETGGVVGGVIAGVAEPAPAVEPAPKEEASGYRDVDLVDEGNTKMADKRDYKNLVVLGMGFFPSTAKVRYRRLLTDNLSVMVGGGYGSGQNDLLGYAMSRVVGLAGADFHPIGNGMHGFYIGPRVKFTSWNFDMNIDVLPDDETDPDAEDDIDPGNIDAGYSSGKLSLKALVGYRVIIKPGLSIAVGLGPKYTSMVFDTGTDDDSFSSGGSGVGVDLEMLLGWAF